LNPQNSAQENNPFLIYFLKIYLRERESTSMGERVRGRRRESQLDSPLSTDPNVRLDLRTLRS